MEFIIENDKLNLSRQNSEQIWVETIYKRKMSTNLNKKITNSIFKLQKNDNEIFVKEPVLFDTPLLNNYVEIKIPNFSRLNYGVINKIDFKGREESLEILKKQDTICLKKSDIENKETSNKLIEELKMEKIIFIDKERFNLTLFNSENPKNKYLQNLLTVSKKFFKNGIFNQDILTLDDGEKKILNSILMRKYKNKINSNCDINLVVSKMESIKHVTITKRPEQNYKLIFMLTLKSLKDNLKKTIGNLRKKDFELYFYNYYFKETSEKYSIPIEHFYHPKNSKAQKKLKSKNTPKTINLYYIENISKSQKFLNDFFYYLDNGLIKDYEKLIDYKLNTLFNRWSISICKNDNKKLAIFNICNYMEQNNKCKLPWDNNELNIAINSTRKLFV